MDYSVLQAVGALILVIGGILGVGLLAQKMVYQSAAGRSKAGALGMVSGSRRVLARLPGRRSIIEVYAGDKRYHLLLAADHSLLLDSQSCPEPPFADETQEAIPVGNETGDLHVIRRLLGRMGM